MFERKPGSLHSSNGNGEETGPWPAEVAALFREHDRLGILCDLLEQIADSLPNAPRAVCAQAVEELEHFIPDHLSREERIFSRLLTDENLRERLTTQHHEDLGLAQELVLALEPLANGGKPEDAEALGYMLRCFFTGSRRSMFLEELAMRAALTRPRPSLRVVQA